MDRKNREIRFDAHLLGRDTERFVADAGAMKKLTEAGQVLAWIDPGSRWWPEQGYGTAMTSIRQRDRRSCTQAMLTSPFVSQSMPPRFRSLWILPAAAAIVGAALGGPWLWLHYAGKPLATLWILWLAASAQPVVSVRYRRAVLAGMSLSLVGDVCLMLPGDHFVAGLIAFLLAHVCYIVAFAPGSSAKARVGGLTLIAAVALLNLAGLLPRIDADLKVPVFAYVAVLASMAGVALARAWTPALSDAMPRSVRFAAAGAVCFVVSDSLLAWDRFAGNIPMPALLVLGTYYVAQWWIAKSVMRR
jgi:uncharacterized membrane protein YhhN